MPYFLKDTYSIGDAVTASNYIYSNDCLISLLVGRDELNVETNILISLIPYSVLIEVLLEYCNLLLNKVIIFGKKVVVSYHLEINIGLVLYT